MQGSRSRLWLNIFKNKMSLLNDARLKNMLLTCVSCDGLEIADNYRETHNKKYYMAWDKRDGHMIR